jgi:hypothetical protein
MNIDQIWRTGSNSDGTIPPKPNKTGEIPFNRLVHNLDRLDDIFYSIPIDSGVVEALKKITPPFNERSTSRKDVKLRLLDHTGSVFEVIIWVIPMFYNGVLTSLVYAADDENQALLDSHRSPVKNTPYDIHEDI